MVGTFPPMQDVSSCLIFHLRHFDGDLLFFRDKPLLEKNVYHLWSSNALTLNNGSVYVILDYWQSSAFHSKVRRIEIFPVSFFDVICYAPLFMLQMETTTELHAEGHNHYTACIAYVVSLVTSSFAFFLLAIYPHTHTHHPERGVAVNGCADHRARRLCTSWLCPESFYVKFLSSAKLDRSDYFHHSSAGDYLFHHSSVGDAIN